MQPDTTAIALPPVVIEHAQHLFIDGQWVDPGGTTLLEVVNPATEDAVTSIGLGTAADVDAAVAAARRAFESFSQTSVGERIALLESIIARYEQRIEEIAAAVTLEMGAPISVARARQAPAGLGHFKATLAALKDFAFEETLDRTTLRYEPIGVAGLITPWNWPLNQTALKVAPALAVGCTVILKPSEVAPLSSVVFASVLEEAGVPAGVFNMVQGEGPVVGAALAEHPDIDIISFTGSNRAGADIARRAADTFKRVAQEMGGKSANIVLDDADLETVLLRDVAKMYVNSGQSCNAGTRILVPRDRMEEAAAIAKRYVDDLVVGPPEDEATNLGPLVSQAQFDKVQSLIKSGIDEGATLVTGGLGRPEGLETGYYAKPTIFADATNKMQIAREEIFGPVLTIIGYEDEDEAVAIANDSDYGLAGMVSSADHERARKIARRMRTGMVHINGASASPAAPFGGYKKSGNGREAGAHGMREFLEVKSLFGDVS
ncbi:3-succinoylsemialdehyde-pyridine dehydrogenase [Frankia canadensis]|uniref:aldehyde dehydrogenase (NAD(+)) n=1 Tax=Frankia canadensis TaxID=1836972 RepID=A0A2I2KVT1_9ACTN|nr:aldehyde dehydrogenase family protein [Frankia canadensis]SNQ49758.1 3-succinoylsemialdehyde-pyridine dehydrogenase [Frankia canadensis]SOU57048.1 3-succinoylsemialdehyde-pyridine dehydrogenase [Frankia canadensis]